MGGGYNFTRMKIGDKMNKTRKTKLTITSALSDSLKWTVDLEVCCDPWSQSTTYPTCERDGKVFSICGICDREWTEVIPATGHTEYVVVEGHAPTCTQNGVTDLKRCSTCGNTTQTQKILPATGHKEITIKGTPATCTSTGLTAGSKCSVCNETIVAQQTIDTLSHNYGAWKTVLESTCVREGKEQRICSSCNNAETKNLEKLNHNHSYPLQIADQCYFLKHIHYFYLILSTQLFHYF